MLSAQLLLIGAAVVFGYFVAGPVLDGPKPPAQAALHDPLSVHFSICGDGPRSDCVVDGDTFWLGRQKIRIADIDTPELSPPRCEAERIKGQTAKQRLLEMLNAGTFALVSGSRDEDQYGRKLRP